MSPRVSLILTTYNCKDNLEQTLQSIQEQDYDNVEIIIKDGGSDDGTLDVIHKYTESGMSIIWQSQHDNGIYDAMNQGYSMSTGEIIAFFNDRFTRNDAITLLVDAIIHTNIEDCIGAHADLVYMQEECVIRSWHMGRGKITHGWMPGHPTLFLKRTIFERYGLFKTDYHCSGDYEFMVRILKNKEDKLAYVNKTLVKMYYGGTSTKGLRGYLVSLREGHRALKENDYHFIWIIDLIRIVRVIIQFGHKESSED